MSASFDSASVRERVSRIQKELRGLPPAIKRGSCLVERQLKSDLIRALRKAAKGPESVSHAASPNSTRGVLNDGYATIDEKADSVVAGITRDFNSWRHKERRSISELMTENATASNPASTGATDRGTSSASAAPAVPSGDGTIHQDRSSPGRVHGDRDARAQRCDTSGPSRCETRRDPAYRTSASSRSPRKCGDTESLRTEGGEQRKRGDVSARCALCGRSAETELRKEAARDSEKDRMATRISELEAEAVELRSFIEKLTQQRDHALDMATERVERKIHPGIRQGLPRSASASRCSSRTGVRTPSGRNVQTPQSDGKYTPRRSDAPHTPRLVMQSCTVPRACTQYTIPQQQMPRLTEAFSARDKFAPPTRGKYAILSDGKGTLVDANGVVGVYSGPRKQKSNNASVESKQETTMDRLLRVAMENQDRIRSSKSNGSLSALSCERVPSVMSDGKFNPRLMEKILASSDFACKQVPSRRPSRDNNFISALRESFAPKKYKPPFKLF